MVDNKYICMLCGDEFTNIDLKKLGKMGESYYVNKKEKSLICPDCIDGFRHKDPEKIVRIVLNSGGTPHHER